MVSSKTICDNTTTSFILGFVLLTGATVFDKTAEFTTNKILGLLIVELFLFILGVVLGAIPFGVVLVIVIISSIFIAVWIRKVYTSTRMA